LKKKNKIKIDIIHDNSLVISEYKIDFKNKSKKTIEKIESLTKLTNLKDLKKENNVFSIKKIIKKNVYKKNKFYKKKFYKKKVK
jgi:ribonuclease E